MITESNIYWMTRLDEIKSFVSVAGFAMCLVFGIALIVCLGGCIVNKVDGDEKNLRTFKKISMYIAPLFLFGVALPISNVFIPTTKQYAMIKVIPAIANDQKIQQEASELYDMAKQALKQTLQIPNVEKPKAEKQENQGSKP
jgi:hypothetical protein